MIEHNLCYELENKVFYLDNYGVPVKKNLNQQTLYTHRTFPLNPLCIAVEQIKEVMNVMYYVVTSNDIIKICLTLDKNNDPTTKKKQK